jgi:hypothetical protein
VERQAEDRVYCMDATQEKAQNWDRLQTYKQKRTHLVNVQAEARKFGRALTPIASVLTKNPTTEGIKLEGEGVRAGRLGEITTRNIGFAEVEWDRLKAILTDMMQTEAELRVLREELAATGTDVSKPLDST